MISQLAIHNHIINCMLLLMNSVTRFTNVKHLNIVSPQYDKPFNIVMNGNFFLSSFLTWARIAILEKGGKQFY